MTMLHELYHKWQFSAIPFLTPIFYVANIFISLFYGYESASKCKWLIEGDVRVNVDNDKNLKEILKLLNPLVMIVWLSNIYVIDKNVDSIPDEDLKNTLKMRSFFKKDHFNLYFNDIHFNLKEEYKKAEKEGWNYKIDKEIEQVFQILFNNDISLGEDAFINERIESSSYIFGKKVELSKEKIERIKEVSINEYKIIDKENKKLIENKFSFLTKENINNTIVQERTSVKGFIKSLHFLNCKKDPEFQFILNLLKEENLLTDDFINFINNLIK